MVCDGDACKAQVLQRCACDVYFKLQGSWIQGVAATTWAVPVLGSIKLWVRFFFGRFGQGWVLEGLAKPVVLWSPGPWSRGLWSSGPVVLWFSGPVVLWSPGFWPRGPMVL